ncbi:hypothetical protein [Bacteroides congonensis]|nr:hypothetical protein [Bacteroides congonensis]
MSYAKRLRTTAPIFVEETRNRSSTGYFNTLFKVEHYQYDYPFSSFAKEQ